MPRLLYHILGVHFEISSRPPIRVRVRVRDRVSSFCLRVS